MRLHTSRGHECESVHRDGNTNMCECVCLHAPIHRILHLLCAVCLWVRNDRFTSCPPPDCGASDPWPLNLQSRFNDPIVSHPGICNHGNIPPPPPPLTPPPTLIMQQLSPPPCLIQSQAKSVTSEEVFAVSIAADVSPKRLWGYLWVKYHC